MKTESNKFYKSNNRTYQNSDSEITQNNVSATEHFKNNFELQNHLNNNPYDSENLDNESESELKDITEQDIENDLRNNDLFESENIDLLIDNQDNHKLGNRTFDNNQLDDSELHRKEFEIGSLNNEQIKYDEFIKNENNPDKLKKDDFGTNNSNNDPDIEEEDPYRE